MTESHALITNDAVVLGILMMILAFVFVTSHSKSPGWKKFYTYVPSLLLCYFLPSLFTTFGVIDPEVSNLYFVSSRFLLPASLVLLTLSIDLPGIMRLGPKAVIMFLTGTVGIVIGGPLAILIMSAINPDVVGGAGPDAVWRGMTTVAGSWIGGSANQTAMMEVFEVGDDLFSAMIAVDVIVANIWMAFLLYAAGRSDSIDARTGANVSAIEDVRRRVEEYRAQDFNLDSTFFWLVVIATTLGLILSYTRARELEGVGASRIGSALLYVLVASVGMRMNIRAVFEDPELFLVGMIWMSFHAGLLIIVGILIKAPVFFLAVGSQANVGGAASAPIVASAFSPALAPVGVLLAVFGYALGTYGAWVCGQLMRLAAGG